MNRDEIKKFEKKLNERRNCRFKVLKIKDLEHISIIVIDKRINYVNCVLTYAFDEIFDKGLRSLGYRIDERPYNVLGNSFSSMLSSNKYITETFTNMFKPKDEDN